MSSNWTTNGSLIERILSPLSCRDFIENFWGKRSLYVPGTVEKLAGLFTMADLWTGLELADPKRVLVRASRDRGQTQTTITAESANDAYKTGATLCVDGLASVEPRLADLARTVGSELGFLGLCTVRAYLSPDRQGYGMHFDRRVAMTLQIDGEKKWRYSNEVALDWPHYQVDVRSAFSSHQARETWERAKSPQDCSFSEVVLRPGDVLCLPAGAWHEAEAQGHSLALNVAFESLGIWSLLAPALGLILLSEPEWREPPPLKHPSTSIESMGPALARGYLRNRLDELKFLVNKISQDDGSLSELWTNCLEIHRERRNLTAEWTKE
jgi:ribosomal protein L16 Arg81 hydroxylase